MDEQREFLYVDEERWGRGAFLAALIATYLFAIAVRYLWVRWAGTHPEFFWNGQIMINTNDGYYWAEGARDILAGHHQPHDLSPIFAPVAMLTAWLAKVLPFSFETIILWMPAVFGSLIVVPVMLIGRALRLDHAGWIAGMLAGIAWSYYNRTMAGYYDTDMLTIVLPTFVLWGMVMAVLTKRNRYMALTALLMVLYQWWYSAAYPLTISFVVMVLLYTLVFERKELYNYKLILFMLLALLPLGWQVESLMIAGAYLLFHFGGRRSDRLVLPLLLAAAGVFVWMGGLNPIWYQIKGYLLRESLGNGGAEHLHFYAVNKTVREAGKIPFETFADRISGHPVLFVLSLIGYLMLALRYRVMWLALPMLALGFLAMKGGLRFTVYAVPPMALGMGYLTVWFAQRLAATVSKEASGQRKLFWGLALLLLALILTPNIRHVLEYKVPTVFVKSEVKVLDRLKGIAKREDYVLAWWDYGYPIRYYSDVKTLIDGGKHTGDVNFPVSYALTKPQEASANMARLDVEYTERSFRTGASGPYLEQMMRDYNTTDPQLFLTKVENSQLKLPPRTREVYYYLPLRMMGIFPTVATFSSIDLETGKAGRGPALYSFTRYGVQRDQIFLGQGVMYDQRTGLLHVGEKLQKINRFVVTESGPDGRVHVQQKRFDAQGRWFLIYMKNYRRFLLMDRAAFDSTYVQLFVLEHYDPEIFEPVILTPLAKVFRLKK
jgi:dolichyl-diphosphooligosaccharide--protein glycosyltransferase/undecaprenyl-diphosphooligosaccharide--protein glycosyltransferase